MGNQKAGSCSIAVIIPVLNEAEQIGPLLQTLERDYRFDEIFIIDGGSSDTTMMVVQQLTKQTPTGPDEASRCRLLQSEPGRGRQMNAGANQADADVLLFLHADTRLPAHADDLIRGCIRDGRQWGRFDVRIADQAGIFRIIAWMMNRRSALTGIATGDQAMFIRQDLFRRLGGYAGIPLMEDIELSYRLKRIERPGRIRQTVLTSARRWRRDGIIHTILLMWVIRFAYWLGVPPTRLARWYR